MDDYKPNSRRFKEEQKERDKKVEKVVTNKVITRKKSGVRKFVDEFVSEDAKKAKSYVWGDVLIPALKKLVSDIVTEGIDIILYGELRGRRKSSTSDRVSYRSYSDRSSVPWRDDKTYASRNGFYNEDIICQTRGEAEDVLFSISEMIDTYGVARVADLYDLVGITAPHTANLYGWTNIRNAEVIAVREGYMIRMPRAIPID